jgi:hypothetical protein
MLLSYFTGVTGIVLVTLCWVWIQKTCREAATNDTAEVDFLTGRTGCHGCPEESCEERSDSVEEGMG